MNSVEILERKAALKDEAQAIIATAQKEIRKLNDGENDRYNAIKTEIESLNEQLRALDVALPIDNKNIHQTHHSMENKFSLLRAIRNVAENRQQDEISRAVIDSGSREARAAAINHVGAIQIPVSEEYRTVTVSTEGTDVVATEMMNIIDPLYAKNTLLQSGVQFLSGLKGDVQFPILASSAATWESETATTSASTPTISSVKLSPHRLSIVVPISKQFLIQESVSAEEALRRMVIDAINAKLEATILGHANTSGQPEGLFYTATSLSTLSSFSDITSLEATIEAANMENYSYIATPAAKAALRNMLKGATTATLGDNDEVAITNNISGTVFDRDEIDGRKCLVTSAIDTAKGIICADFSQMVMAQFGSLDLTVDNYTLAADGCVRLVVNSYWDFKVLRSTCYKAAKLA